MLDLKNRANVLQFMNIIVDETPEIPYDVHRYVNMNYFFYNINAFLEKISFHKFHLNNGIDMSLQVSFIRKWWVTIMIFLSIINWINVILQVSCLRKYLSTWDTFVFFLTIVNWINVFLQVSWNIKWLFTWVTFVVFLTHVNWINVHLQTSCSGK